MSDGGKGSRQRPTDKSKFDQNWNIIFKKSKEPDSVLKDKNKDSTVDLSKKDK
jgi:hypothetical protein